jgi:hypothetical protein
MGPGGRVVVVGSGGGGVRSGVSVCVWPIGRGVCVRVCVCVCVCVLVVCVWVRECVASAAQRPG